MKLPGRWIALSLLFTAIAIVVVLWPHGDITGTSEDVLLPAVDRTPATRSQDELVGSDEGAAPLFAFGDACARLAELEEEELTGLRSESEKFEDIEELMTYLAEPLSVSSSAEHLYVAALLDPRVERRVDLIERAASLTPDDVQVVWGAIQVCASADGAANCAPEWEQRVLALDSENSEVWMRIAANRYKGGSQHAALSALRRAAASAETREYWPETIAAIERGLSAVTDLSFRKRAGLAFAVAGSNRPNYADYVIMCDRQSQVDVEWAYACLAYGERVEQQASVDSAVNVGLWIQQKALQALGEVESLAAAEQRAQRLRARMRTPDPVAGIGLKLVFTNPTLFEAYLAEISARGETGAREYLKNEVRRLQREHPDWECLREPDDANSS